MCKTKLNTAVLGLEDAGQHLLEAASKMDYFQIQAVADKDTRLAEKVAARYNCAAYDDYRQFIMQNQFDCLLVAAGMHSCDKYIRIAIKKKFNVLKLAPLARNFEEASEFVSLAEVENIKFGVANPSRFAGSFLALRQFVQQASLEQVFLVTAFCNVGEQFCPPWQSDPKLAGGGVLLRNCYEIIDQILWNFGLPQQVYSLNTNTAADRQQRCYLTEDTAVVTMKFTDASFGNLTTSRAFGPEEIFLKLYAGDRVLTVSNTQFEVRDSRGQVNEESQYDDDRSWCMDKVLENFALSILSPEENKLCSSGSENLKNMAVIEATYLSARTGFPEEPGRILKMRSKGPAEPTNIRTSQE